MLNNIVCIELPNFEWFWWEQNWIVYIFPIVNLNLELEYRANPFLGGNTDFTAHALSYLFTDAETQAYPFLVELLKCAWFVELAEKSFLRRLAHANSIILNFNDNHLFWNRVWFLHFYV